MYAKEIETISDRLITLVRRREKRTISISSECIQFHVMFVCVCFPSFKFEMLYVVLPMRSPLRVRRRATYEYMPDIDVRIYVIGCMVCMFV